MEKLKVLFISAANSIHTVKWVNALSDSFQIHLVYCKNHKPNIDNINSEVILHELKHNAPLGYYLNSFQLKKIYKKINPNIVNVHYASGYGTLARIAKLKKIILSVWGSDVYDFPNTSKINKKILQKNVMFASNIASTSNAMAEELKKQVPMLNNKIHITPFGVDTEKFNKTKNISRNTFNIGNVKSLKEIYGIEYSILAVKYLKEKLIKEGDTKLAELLKLFIYGDGPQREELENLVKNEELTDTVFFQGKISNEEVPKALNNLDVFCITSNNESFGVSVVEAMACELPVVATNVDGFKEIMKNNITGYIVEKRDIVQIANALEILLKNKEQRIEFGRNGRKRVLEQYNWRDNVEYMKRIYLENAKVSEEK